MRSAPTLVCELRRSRVELGAILLAIAAALAAALVASMAVPFRVVLVAATLPAGALAFRDRLRRPWIELALAGNGALVLRGPSGPEWRGTLTEATVLGPLVVLTARDAGGGTVRLPIYPDSVDADAQRRLRVLLRHGWRAESADAIR